jgi:two-component system C4-dicarboxylate transport sensor histidine kinase DctB
VETAAPPTSTAAEDGQGGDPAVAANRGRVPDSRPDAGESPGAASAAGAFAVRTSGAKVLASLLDRGRTIASKGFWTPQVTRWALFGLGSACMLVLLTWTAGRFAADEVRRDLAQRANAAAALHSAVLRSEFEKFRSLPVVLTEDHDVREALRVPRQGRLLALDAKLETLSQQTRAGVIYVLDPQGVAIAASNWRRVDSFVGTNYSYRPYFHDAMRGHSAEHFALGAISGKPGLFFARRIESEGKILGVVVVKVEFDNLEQEWQGSDPAFVTGPDNVVLLTSVPDWRFRSFGQLSAVERARLRKSLQFGQGPLTPLPFEKTGPNELEVDQAGKRSHFVAAATPATSGWTLHLLMPSDGPVTSAVISARSMAFLASLLLTIGAGVLLYRRGRFALKVAAESRARAELESRVLERTSALRVSNERLILEMAERRRLETSRQTLQDELVQASKLATLGQIAAGVAHEINQPVAAIRTYADNATVLLERADTGAARGNLASIAALTEKIGLITDELRAFSRKTGSRPEPIEVDEAIGGALLLIGSRARQLGVTIVREGSAGDAKVLAERVRLEQVLVNLLQNALEALADQPDGVIRLGVQAASRRVRITVGDNGPGLAPETAATLFTPFVTTKPDGLGLGLVISRDLITEFGGELTLKEAREGGALFVISLKRAV